MEETSDQDKSIKQLLLDIKTKMDEKKVEKKRSFKIPFLSKVGNKKAEKGWATYLMVNDNRTVSFIKKPISEQTVMIDGVPRIATADDALIYKGKPFYIQPSWSVKPFSPSENYEQTHKENNSSAGYRLLLNRMQTEVIKPKGSFGGIWIFVGILALIILGYIAKTNKWF